MDENLNMDLCVALVDEIIKAQSVTEKLIARLGHQQVSVVQCRAEEKEVQLSNGIVKMSEHYGEKLTSKVRYDRNVFYCSAEFKHKGIRYFQLLRKEEYDDFVQQGLLPKEGYGYQTFCTSCPMSANQSDNV